MANRWLFPAALAPAVSLRKDKPFFLFFALHEPHMPRVPAARYVGKTGLGPRGGAGKQFARGTDTGVVNTGM